MTRFLYLNIPASGHVNPALGVVGALRQRGAEVICVNDEAYRAKLEQAGGTFVPYPSLPEYDALEARQHEGNIAYNCVKLLEIGQRLLPFTRDLIRTHRPDAVIFDSLAGWGRWAAALEGVPAAAFITTFVFAPGAVPPMSPAVFAKTALQFVRGAPDYLRVRGRLGALGVRGVGYTDPVTNASPSCNIVFTSRQFQPDEARLGAAYTFVGASLGNRTDPLDLDLSPDLPLVYVSLGTVNNQNPAFYRACFAALGDLPVQVVLSVGHKTDLAALGTPPANTTVRPFVAQLEVLRRAAAFVTHGGLNSVHEGLTFGVPLVVVPQQVEQGTVAQRVAKLGAGIALMGEAITPAQLRAAVQRALSEPALRAQSAALGKSLAEAGGAPVAAETLLAWLSRQPASATAPARG